MVTTCVAVGCTNRQVTNSGKSFYRFPADPDRKRRWIAAIQRQGWQPTNGSRICSDHFVSGKSDDPMSPDYVPSVFAHLLSPQKRKRKSLEVFERRTSMKRKRKQEETRSQAAAALLSLSVVEHDATVEENVASINFHQAVPSPPQSKTTTAVQTDLTSNDIEAIINEAQHLTSENLKLRDRQPNITDPCDLIT